MTLYIRGTYMTSIVNQQENINNQTDLIKNANAVTGNFHAGKKIKLPPVVLMSTNYTFFKPHPLQRAIQPKNLMKIRQSIENHDLTHEHPLKVISPIGEVSENNPYLVWDGNHRLNIIKERQTPIYFVISDDFRDSDITDTGFCLSKWNIQHFCDFYCKQGKEEYIKFKRFYTDYKIDIKTALPLTKEMKNRTHLSDIFRDGKFVFDNERERRHKVELAVQFLEKCVTYKMATLDFYRNGNFFDGFIKLIDHPKFDMNKIMDRLEKGAKKESKIPKYSKFVSFYNLFKEDFLGINPTKELME